MFGSRRPEKSRRGKFWDWLNPGLGKAVPGWLIGPLVGVETHYVGRTQPCRHYITGGRMGCYCKTAQLAMTWKGYVPLLDQNGVQAFCIIGERYEELAASIPIGAPVEVWRLRSAGSPVCVKQSDWTIQPPPLHSGQKMPRDIRPWLLKLWNDTALLDWMEAHPEVADETPAAGPLEQSVSPMLKAAARRAETPAAIAKRSEHTRPNLPGTLADALPHVPGVNGKGRK